MMLIIKRAHKLDEYNLKFVAKHFLKTTEKISLDYKEMFIVYTNMITEVRKRNKGLPFDQKVIDDFTKVVDYGVRDADLCVDLFEKLNTWNDLIESCNLFSVNNPIDMFTKGAQSKGINQVYKFCYKKGYVFNFRSGSIKNYEGAKVFDPINGVKHNCIFLDFQAMYPNLARANNLSWDSFIPKHMWHLFKPDEYNVFFIKQTEKVNPGDKKCKETKEVEYEFRFLKGQHLMYEILTYLLDTRKLVKQEIANEKDETKKSILKAKENALKVGANGLYGLTGMKEDSGGRLTMLEIAMSITYLGRMDILKSSKHMFDKYQFITIYGDTDSCCLYNINRVYNASLCEAWGRVACHEINGGPATYIEELDMHLEESPGLFNDRCNKTNRIEYEKGCIGQYSKKKCYFIIHIKKDGFFGLTVDSVFNKGNVKARRLECNFIRDTIGELHLLILVGNVLCKIAQKENKHLYMILEEMESGGPNFEVLCKKHNIDRNNCPEMTHMIIYEILLYLCHKITMLLNGNVDYKKLERRMNMGSNYDNPNNALRILSERLESIGKPIQPGTRMNILVTRIKDERKDTKKGKKYRLVEEYIDSLNTDEPIQIDYDFYLVNALCNPFDTSFNSSYSEYIDRMYPMIVYKPPRGANEVTLKTPCKLIYQMAKNNQPIGDIFQCLMNVNSNLGLM
jgi:DNA polymerase elongation subunit (family B)